MKILVLIDFSPCALNALAYAISLGKVMQAELILFHAFHPLLDRQGPLYKDEQLTQQEEQKARAKMRSIALTFLIS